MGKVRDLITKASKDFELAKEHRRLRDYVIATLLYNSVVEQVLRALFISRTKKEPPAKVSLEYLARRAGVPEEISMYVSSMQDELVEPEAHQFIDLGEENSIGRSSESQVLYLDGLARRLLDYVTAYTKV